MRQMSMICPINLKKCSFKLIVGCQVTRFPLHHADVFWKHYDKRRSEDVYKEHSRHFPFHVVLQLTLFPHKNNLQTKTFMQQYGKSFKPFPLYYESAADDFEFCCQKIENLLRWMDDLWLKVENIVEKGEIYRFEQFLLLLLCFQNPSAAEASESVHMRENNN